MAGRGSNKLQEPRLSLQVGLKMRPYTVRVTTREILMLNFTNDIIHEADWHKKVFDEPTVQIWRDEAQDAGMTEMTFNFCVLELRDKADFYKQTGYVATLDAGAAVVITDAAVSQVLREVSEKTCEELQDFMKHDWPLKSGGPVVDLVDPCLYPLICGKSRIVKERLTLDNCLSFIGEGEIMPTLLENFWDEHGSWAWSYKYQWLPCEIDLRSGHPKCSSYINNLQPERFRSFYSIIELLVEQSIPLWNECLKCEVDTPTKRIEYLEVVYDLDEDEYKSKLHIKDEDQQLQFLRKLVQPEGLCHWCRQFGFVASNFEDVHETDINPLELEKSIFEAGTLSALLEKIWYSKRKVVLPEPTDYASYVQQKSSFESFDLLQDWRDKGLQVIVKVVSIELSPANPDFPGGAWEVEGMQHEHICATSMFYFRSDNVGESRLSFQQQAELRLTKIKWENIADEFDQHEKAGIDIAYGLKEGECSPENHWSMQELGSVATKEGRLLAFSNCLQHKMEPFSLIDASKPGSCSFIVLWLIDPHKRLLSTAHVPPQQYEWWQYAVEALTNVHERLPPELAQMVIDEGKKDTITRDEAQAFRLETMAERTKFLNEVHKRGGRWNL